MNKVIERRKKQCGFLCAFKKYLYICTISYNKSSFAILQRIIEAIA